MPTYDPTKPTQDPRQQMSSGGPGNYPTQPANPLFDPTKPIGSGAGATGGGVPGTGGTTTSIGYGPGQMQPGDHTGGFFGGLVHELTTSGILGSGDAGRYGTAFDQINRALPDQALATINGGAGGGQTPMSPLGGAPQIPGLDMGPGGAGGGVGTLEGLDFTKPGALEQYQRDTRGYFGQPTLSEMFAKDALARGAGPGVSNRSEQAFQQFNASTPANMNPYYDNQRRIAEENIRKTMAARGSYGSSAADDLYNEAYTNLAADQAQKEAQYGLQRGSLLGSLAQGADSSSLAGSADRRNWMGALGSLAGQGDAAGLARITGGANIAGAAQGAQRARGQDAFNNQLTMGDRLSGILGSGYGNIFGTDKDLFLTGVGLNTGTAAEGYNQASQGAAQNRADVSNFNNLLGGNLQYGRGLIDMFSQPSTPDSPGPSPMPGYYQNPNDAQDLARVWVYRP